MAYGLSSNNYMMEKEKFHRTLNETRALLIRKCTDSKSFRRNFDFTLIGMDAEITNLTKYFNTYCSSQYASFDDYYINEAPYLVKYYTAAGMMDEAEKLESKIKELKNLAVSMTDFREEDIVQRSSKIIFAFTEYMQKNGLMENAMVLLS